MRPLAIVLVAASIACHPRPVTTVRFAASADDVLNPERGFMVDIDLVRGRDFRWVRDQGYTLAYAGVRLDGNRTEALSHQLHADLDLGFEAVRDAGIKVVLRFVYNDAADGADAPKWAMLAHIDQLRPLLQKHADVIAVMDAGFIGAWGEWHSSTHGLDNPRDRGDILYAVLRALPASRSVTVRSPRYKVDAYGDPMPAARAFDGSDPARVGHHNSCFLASDTDLGTYTEPIERWKSYVAHDGRFTPVGGETCRLNPPRSDCSTATAELRRLHWSFLNALYHQDVLDRWRTDGCYREIARDLGYRLELSSVTFDQAVAPGGRLRIAIRLRNTGYAAMFNARPVYVTLGPWQVRTAFDPRRWEPGVPVDLELTLRIPANATPGRHRLGLYLPDADERLQTPARVGLYAVRIANAVWDSPINVLSDAVVIDTNAPGPVDPTAATLELISFNRPSSRANRRPRPSPPEQGPRRPPDFCRVPGGVRPAAAVLLTPS